MAIISLMKLSAQDDNPFVSYDVPAQNLLKFNRFLINPTFSTVREDKSYVNLLHRNQSVQFKDNNQDYFLSYSGRVNDRTGLGLSVFTQREGVLSNYGVLANYAYGIKLSDKSNFTFGANISYYRSGLDRNRIDANNTDPFINAFEDSNLVSFQPGFNISYGKFDFGLFAENLFDYNLKTSKSASEFKDKTFSGHLQYTHQFTKATGLLEEGRLMPLARVRKAGEEEVVLGGSLILDLPKIGWLQAGYDSFYGAAAGVGFNLNKRISLGYTMEKGLSGSFDNFGTTHEISFAYSFTPNLTEDRVLLEDDFDELASLEDDLKKEPYTSKDEEIADLKRRLAENDDILAELMYRQDSIENSRDKDLERRFEMVMKMVRRETRGENPDLEEKARQMYFINNKSNNALVENSSEASNKKPISIKNIIDSQNSIEEKQTKVYPTTSKDKIAVDKTPSSVKKTAIKSRKFNNVEGVDDGYYLVANVYKGGNYHHKFVDKLNADGIEADYFENKNNGLKYVYLKRYDTWQEAAKAHKSNASGSYNGDLWVMNVDNSRYTNSAYAANVKQIAEKASRYDDNLQTNVVVKDKVVSNQQPITKKYRIDGVGKGYYIIANVFANASNANRFVKLLNDKGFNASYFINPKNNYRYVYLKKHDSWNNALVSYYTKLDNAYENKMWIMRVTPNTLT